MLRLGIYGLHHIINTNKYNKISLIGFDNFEQGKQRYFFSVKDYNPSLYYLIGNKISVDNVTVAKSLHCELKTIEYLETQFKTYNNITFELFSTIKFKNNFENMKLL